MSNEASPTAAVNVARHLLDRGYGRLPQALEIDLKAKIEAGQPPHNYDNLTDAELWRTWF